MTCLFFSHFTYILTKSISSCLRTCCCIKYKVQGVKVLKILTVTISDDAHAKLEEIKTKHGFNNNAEALEWIIQEVAKA